MNTEPELLNERLERLAIVLDEIMPRCALLVRDAIDLLKEQDTVVRCKDCKYHGKDTCSAGAGIAYPPPDDWYCADGERRRRS